MYFFLPEDKFVAQLQQLQQKLDEYEIQRFAAIEKLRKEFMEMKKVVLDAQRDTVQTAQYNTYCL